MRPGMAETNPDSDSTSSLQTNFFDIFTKQKIEKTEKMARTLFHQLISGIEYLHSEGVSHLDLKLENLLMGEDFNMKIADFDMSFRAGDKSVKSQGTRNYRAPELRDNTIRMTKSADIYSAGIILFNLLFRHLPHSEGKLIKGHNLTKLMSDDPSKFWQVHAEMNPTTDASEPFK